MFKKKQKNTAPAPEAEPAKKRRVSRWKIVLAALLFLVAAVCMGLTWAGWRVSSSPCNLPRVYVGGIFVGGMDEEQTRRTLEAAGWQASADEPMTVKLPADVSFTLDVVKAGAMFSLEEAVSLAHHYGHDRDWFGNLYTYLKNTLRPVDVSGEYGGLREDYIREETERALARFREKTADRGYERDEEKQVLRLMKGAGQMELDVDRLCAEIGRSLLQGDRLLERTRPDNQLQVPDFQALHDELYAEAQDARYDEKFEVIDETVGYDFDVALAESAWRAAKATEYYEIPYTRIEPEVTGEQLRAQLYRDRLGSQTTLYTWSSDNRINNIKLCASRFDGMILYPGETFSFNDVVGQRTREAGFLEAGAYSDGEVVQELGGGICQVSSTLYCASMYAQMKTVHRESHYFRVDYLPLGYDATVSWGRPDFKFRNDREFPVRLAAWCDDEAKSLTVEIWGTDVDGSYVELSYRESPVYDEEYPDVLIATDAVAFRNVYDKNGSFLYQQKEPAGRYHLHEEEIQWPEEKEEELELEGNPAAGILPDLEDLETGSDHSGIIIVS